ncbi:MAG TPA: hypothetical protein VIL97_02775 [Thermoanaerobaculia bacterium]
MVRVALILLMVLPGACRTIPGSRSDVESLLKVALAQVEKDEQPVTIVAGEKLDPKVLEVARTMRTVVATSELPGGHFRLDRVVIEGDKAEVSGWLGPIPKAKQGEILLACGTGYQWTLERLPVAPFWKVERVGVAVC